MPWGSGGGYPARSSQGGVPWPGGTLPGGTRSGTPPSRKGQDGGYPGRGGYPGQVPPPRPGQDGGVPWPGGYPAGGGTRSGTPPQPGQDGGYPGRGGTLVRYPPPARSGWGGYPAGGGGTQVGQQKEYSLHGGRYASCVHAGGLSCFIVILHTTF